MTSPPVLLTIAGFDPSNGAGITADLQVFAAHGMFGTSAITALTVQSTLGVRAVQPVDEALLAATLSELQADLPPVGIKIGMLGSAGAVRSVAAFLGALPTWPTVVLDPVLRSSSGHDLLKADAIAELQERLLPLVDWVTPNWEELAVLSGLPVRREAEALEAMAALAANQAMLGIVATGGDLEDEPLDILRLPDGQVERFTGQRVQTTSTHGTGCAFSSALLCGLVRGQTASTAVRQAKHFVEGALRHAPGVGGGRGPMDLLWPLRRENGRRELLYPEADGG